MATATIGFVNVNGRVEPEAIAGAIAANAHSRVGQFVGCTFDWFADQGQELTQVQKCELVTNALRFMDGFEAEVIASVMEGIPVANEVAS